MPLTLTLTEGVLPRGSEKATFAKLCEAMLKWHGLSGNRAITPNVIGSVRVLGKNETFAGMTETPVVFIEWKMPSFAFAERRIQQGYIEEATNIVHEASGRAHPKEHIWCNIVHAVDGGWGIGGTALTNQELGESVSKG